MGQITFYAENGCINELGMLQDTPGQWINLQDENNTGIPDNKIRSCMLSNVRGGAVIRLYDSPIGDTSLDWTRIEIKDVEKDIPTIVIPTFEHSMEDEWFKIECFEKDGLDGKISLIEID